MGSGPLQRVRAKVRVEDAEEVVGQRKEPPAEHQGHRCPTGGHEQRLVAEIELEVLILLLSGLPSTRELVGVELDELSCNGADGR